MYLSVLFLIDYELKTKIPIKKKKPNLSINFKIHFYFKVCLRSFLFQLSLQLDGQVTVAAV